VLASERAITQAPNIAEAHALAGLALFGMKRFDEADRRLRHAIDIEPRTEWLMAAAKVALRRGDLAGATKHWRAVVAAEPRSRVAAQAREALEQAMRLHETAGADHAL
jgi:tetratricopeptide (TPR) repeat protein